MSSTTSVISADRHERLRQFLKDLWDYRELFWTFLERDVKVRYKQTGFAQPALTSGHPPGKSLDEPTLNWRFGVSSLA